MNLSLPHVLETEVRKFLSHLNPSLTLTLYEYISFKHKTEFVIKYVKESYEMVIKK